MAWRTASATPWVHGSPCPGSSRPGVDPEQRVQRGERLAGVRVQPGRHDLRAEPAGQRILRGHDVAGEQGPAALDQDRRAARCVAGRVYRPRAAGYVDLLAVGEGRHLRDRDHPPAAAAQEGKRGPVERRPEQVGRDLSVVLARLAGARGLLIRAVDPYPRAGLGAGPLGEPGVVGVRVGEQHRVQIGQLAAESGERAREERPVGRGPGIDQGVLAGFLDQVEVRDALRQPVDALAHLHWLAFP